MDIQSAPRAPLMGDLLWTQTMASIHQCSLRSSQLPSNIQLACDGIHVALPTGRNEVAVWDLQDITQKPLELHGHHHPPTAMNFSHRVQPTMLCTGAQDYIILWNIDKARHWAQTGQQIQGKVIGTTLGTVTYVSFSQDDTQVAACVDKIVYILDTGQERILAELEGHQTRVNCAEFCPHYSSTIVTAGDDRTFKVWDLQNQSLVYQSSIISSSPFLSISMNPQQNNFVIGTTDGQLRSYDLTDGNGFRCLQHLDVQKLQDKLAEQTHSSNVDSLADKVGPVTISSNPSWQQQQQRATPQTPASPVRDEETQVGAAILALHYTVTETSQRTPTPSHLPFLQRENTLVSELLHNAPMLAIATTGAIIQVNAKTLEPCACVLLEDSMKSSDMLQESGEVTLSIAGNMAMAQNTADQQLWALVGSAFSKQIDVISVSPPSEQSHTQLTSCLQPHKNSNEQQQQEQEETISVLSCAPLVEKSPLKAEMVLKSKSPEKMPKKSSYRAVTPAGQLSKKGHILDNQPIVFRQKVQSSGYSQTEKKRQMFRPNTNLGQSSSSKTMSATSSSASSKKEYPMKCDPPTKLKTKLDVADRPTAITSCTFSGDGSHVACGLGNTTAQVFSMPLTGKGCAFAGHKGVVSSVYWSCSNQWLLSSSDDRTASLWSTGLADPLMTFTNANNNFGVDKERGVKTDKDNPAFSSSIKFGQFYYMDKFIILTCANSFNLYKYHLDPSKSDIKRYLTHNRYKLVQSFQMTEAQGITAFSAINSFYSYLAFCAGSNKCVEIFDMNVGRSVRTIPDVHSRSVHTIKQNEGSSYVSHPGAAYDLFVTAAASDCIKLWDLRSTKCVRRYEGHANRTHPCGVDISPCARFIATGSEDRSAYIFDIRSGTYLHKLTGHTDTVGQVAFHPVSPLLLTTTLDGKLRMFSST